MKSTLLLSVPRPRISYFLILLRSYNRPWDIHGCPAFSIEAACTGFIYALATADKFIRSGETKCALVIGAEIITKLVDWKDRSTCVLFGDGAGAVIVKPSDEPGIISTHLGADGKYKELLYYPVGPSKDLATAGTDKVGIIMRGNEVFKVAVKTLGTVAQGGAQGKQYRPERTRLADSASGKPADHSGHCQASEAAAGEGHNHRAGSRQHFGRVGTDGTRRWRSGWQNQTRPVDIDGGIRWRIHLGLRPHALLVEYASCD